MSLGDLQAEVLGVVQRRGKASARDVMDELEGKHDVAYTTVGTVLERLYRKGMLKRTKMTGRGGAKYLYSPASTGELRASLVQRALNQLVNAFGPSIVPTIYDNLDRISQEETDELKKKIDKAKK
jgi:predicted transcriptional regulator